jgi:hypothetical protein
MPRASWDDYRQRRALAVFLLVGFLPAGVCATALSNALIGSDKHVDVFALSWMVAYGVASIRFSRFPCPRCDRAFFLYRGWYYHPWTRQCLHCSWPKWYEYDVLRDPPAKGINGDDEKEKCLSCGTGIPADQDTCRVCGWSYGEETFS